jgi:hypothetical protein
LPMFQTLKYAMISLTRDVDIKDELS